VKLGATCLLDSEIFRSLKFGINACKQIKKEEKAMKKRLPKLSLEILFLLFCISGFLILGLHGYNSTPANDKNEHESYKMEQPPESLDKLYPPQAEEPILLAEMVKLALFFTSINQDALQGDWENAQVGFDHFKEQIIKLSGMIPEWKEHFKMDLVEELGRAVAQKKVPAIMEVRNKKVKSAICGECHDEHRVVVWYRYHWKDFGKITIDDPVSQKTLSFDDFMFELEGSLLGINVDMQQGQASNAQKTFKGFTSRVETLKKACNECHDPNQGEKKYYISADVMGMITDFGVEISKPSPATEKVDALFMGIGMEMCYESHQVHLPAGYIQRLLLSHDKRS